MRFQTEQRLVMGIGITAARSIRSNRGRLDSEIEFTIHLHTVMPGGLLMQFNLFFLTVMKFLPQTICAAEIRGFIKPVLLFFIYIHSDAVILTPFPLLTQWKRRTVYLYLLTIYAIIAKRLSISVSTLAFMSVHLFASALAQ